MTDSTKITYTSTASDPAFDAAFDAARAEVEGRFGERARCSIGGEPSASGQTHEVRSPIDTRRLLGSVEIATPQEGERAVDLAHAAFPGWRSLGWPERARRLRAAADLIQARKLPLAALMCHEVGKTRLEAMAEVVESADLLRYYCARMEANAGYRIRMESQGTEHTESLLVPYGVWGVISPFNFPTALAAGMIGGALVAGNTVVFKPSHQAPLSGVRLAEILWEAGIPRDVLHLVVGPGSSVGAAIAAHPRTQGMAFTGSYEVGMSLYKGFPRNWPKPVVVEMGGKNPALVMPSADLDAAAEGVARSAFSFGGQKCSACSRAYVAAGVFDAFVAKLVSFGRTLRVGDPLLPENYVGPLIDERSVAKYERYVGGVKESGGEILLGGAVRRDGDLSHGHYVEPTVARIPDGDHPYFLEEMFVPLVLVHPVKDLDEALERSNRASYGLTAGIFSSDADEVRRFLDGIESGVTYVNRRAGATTGAWPGVNPFGGWKGSGGTGPAALGPHYLLKFMREQSRTVHEIEL